MPICILKFDDENAAQAAFTAASVDIAGSLIAFKGLLSVPEKLGESEMTEKYFTIVNSLELPPQLMEYEYDYSYPVAADINITIEE